MTQHLEPSEILEADKIRLKIRELEETVMSGIRELQSIKSAHPDFKSGYIMHPGAILNAYRNGDLTFDECVPMLYEVISPAREAVESCRQACREALIGTG